MNIDETQLLLFGAIFIYGGVCQYKVQCELRRALLFMMSREKNYLIVYQ